MARILVTGAAGFVGRALCARLLADGHDVIGTVRARGDGLPPGCRPHTVGEITPESDWGAALHGVELVYHLAQRAHRPGAAAAFAGEPAAAAHLADAAIRAGAKRLVYFSSIKAMGETTRPGQRFRAADEPRPADDYGRAKLASEAALVGNVRDSGMELVILRPPLVYGPEVKANFRALTKLAASGLPLPFAAVDNRRSMMFVANLADAAARAGFHPAAAGQVLLVRDDVDLSTPELIRRLRAALGRPVRLFALPAPALSLAAKLPGFGRLRPLLASLQVDDGPTRQALGWSPPVTLGDALAQAARAFVR